MYNSGNKGTISISAKEVFLKCPVLCYLFQVCWIVTFVKLAASNCASANSPPSSGREKAVCITSKCEIFCLVSQTGLTSFLGTSPKWVIYC